MATVKEIREWLDQIPDTARFIVWAEDRELSIVAVAHVADDDAPGWTKAIVVASRRPFVQTNGRHLHTV